MRHKVPTLCLLVLVLLAAVPAASAGPTEDAVRTVFGVTDPVMECLSPDSRCIPPPCGECISNLLDDPAQPVAGAVALACERVPQACDLSPYLAIVGGAADDAGGAAAALVEQATGDGNDAIANAMGSLGKVPGTVTGAYETGHGAAQSAAPTVDAALPRVVFVSCSQLGLEDYASCHLYYFRNPPPNPVQ